MGIAVARPPPIGAQALLELIDAMLRDLRGPSAAKASLDDHLERTLGFDSLSRMELLLRVERAFGVRLPEVHARDAQTPRDLLRALAAAAPREQIDFVGEPPAPRSRVDALPHRAATLVDVLEWHAARHPAHPHVTFDDDAGEPRVLTYRALLEKARAVAGGLQHAGVEPGRCVALMLPSGLDFFAAFAGIALAGAVPVPIYPPLRAEQLEEHLRRQAAILDNARAQFLVADALTRPAARVLRTAVASLRGVVCADELAGRGNAPAPACLGANDIAFLQYTSGSTGQPKGVVMTHANLLANLRAMGTTIGAGPHDRFVSWLPLYHDMGLIGAWMGSLYYGIALWLMPPQLFLARPAKWLHALHRHRGTLSAAPNFAYEVVASKVPDDELRGLDLSAWRLAFNGAEPIHAATLKRFAERFARYGFDPRAMYPVYGLAECGLGLAFPPPGRGLRIDRIDRDALHRNAFALPASAHAPALEVVSCGLPLPGHQIRIVDASGAEAPERNEGRVQFRGPSATSGYFRNDAATRELFDGDWLDTGDVGYVAEGELYLTSRAKELIIRGGHNLHPYELEQAVGELPGVRRGCVAVFGARDATSATERIVVLAEVRERDVPARAALRERIAGLALSILGVPADDIVLADARVVLKTSSGKVRRAACREFYERGLLHAPLRPVPVQLARLVAHGLAARARAGARAAMPLLESAWLWMLVVLVLTCALVGISWWPSLAARRRGVRAVAKALLRCCAIPPRVEGAEHLARGGPTIYVANHASYVDWLVLLSVLPPDVTIVAKSELANRRLLGWVVGRVGLRFVTRHDAQRGVEDTRSLVEAARSGESLLLFPEGTLSRVPGLRPFRMGAFVVSAESAVPVVPVALRGTRSVLRDGTRRLRRHPLAVHAGAALHPRGAGWSEAVALRDAARAHIARHCGEPDLGAGAPS